MAPARGFMLDTPEHHRPQDDWGYQSFFEHAVEGIFRTSTTGRYLQANPSLAALYGFESPAQLIAELTDIADQLYVDPGRRAAFADAIGRQGFVRDFESEIRRRDGSRIWISEHARVVRDERGRVMYYEGTVEDITARKHAERALRESEERSRTLVDAAHNPIVIWRPNGRASFANLAARRTFGFQEDGSGPSLVDLAVEDGAALAELEAVFRGDESGIRQERLLRRPDGAVVEVLETLTPLRRDGQAVEVVAEYHDLSELRAANRRLHDAVSRSALTGLPNRRGFIDRVRDEVSRARSMRSVAAVVVIDLDRFKLVNDSLGQVTGDAVLRSVAHRIQEETAKLSGVVSLGHLDGDQYAVLLSGNKAAEAGVVERTARNILAAIASPLVADGQSLVLAASAGAALFPEHAMEGGDLLSRAERAMYRAKEAGGARLALGGEPEDRLREQLRLEYELRQAAEEGAFVLHYQPVLDVEQGCISSVEALIRWPHPERGLMPPAEFVPVLQQLGLMEAVTAWVIDEACRQGRAWQQEGLALSVAVNVPPKMAEAGSLVHLANAAVVRHELPPSALEFEITETAAIERLDLALAGLDALVAAGFRLAIDDFGVGHSSLARLRELPASKMKIDRSLVARVDTDPDSLAILRGLVELGRATGMCVLAEGVETLGEFETVVLSGVGLVQGYAISRPVPAADVPGLVSSRPARRRAA